MTAESEEYMGGQAFEAPRFNGFMLDPDEIKIVGIDLPMENADGTQHFLYDPRVKLPLPESFVLNVMALGVKKPIIITKEGEDAIVVDGRQRVRAAREAKKRLTAMGESEIFRVPVLLQKGEEELLLKISISTNEFTVEDTQLVKARKAQKMLDRGITEVEVAAAFGVTTKSIQNWLKILGLSAPVRKAVEAELITPSAAAELASLPPDEQKVKLEELVGGETRPTIKETRQSVRKSSGGKTSTVPGKKVVTFIIEKGYEEYHVAEDFVLGLKFAQGNLENLEAIDGLTEAVKAAHSAPAKKRSKFKE
jgi:ParB family chromosome partitioning protein